MVAPLPCEQRLPYQCTDQRETQETPHYGIQPRKSCSALKTTSQVDWLASEHGSVRVSTLRRPRRKRTRLPLLLHHRILLFQTHRRKLRRERLFENTCLRRSRIYLKRMMPTCWTLLARSGKGIISRVSSLHPTKAAKNNSIKLSLLCTIRIDKTRAMSGIGFTLRFLTRHFHPKLSLRRA